MGQYIKSEPLISVVIPCYNSSEHLDRGLQSVINQTYKNIEIICVDNNSTDNTWSKLKAYESNFENLKVVSEKKQGAPFARNTGTTLSQGEWIQYFDIDDELLPNKIQHQIDLINTSEKEVDFISEGWIVVSEKGERINNTVSDNHWLGMFNGRIGHTNSVLIRKRLIQEAGGWDTNLKSSQERELFFRILKLNPSLIISHALNDIVYKRSGSISTNQNNKAGNTVRYAMLRFSILQHIVENENHVFLENKAKLLKESFETIRFAYKYDPIKVFDYYLFIKKSGFEISETNESRGYKFLYNLIGFKATQKIYTMFRK